MVELALALPLLLLLSVGVGDVGRAFYYREAVVNANREELHLAISAGQQATGNTACGGNGTLTGTVGSAVSTPLSAIVTSGGLESSSTGAASGSSIAGATTTVTWHCSGGQAVTGTTATSTDPTNPGSASIEVRTSYTFSPLTPLVAGIIGSPPIVSDTYGRATY